MKPAPFFYRYKEFYMTGISTEQERKIRELIDQRRMIDAIKLYREATGVGLKEAKDAITEMWHGKPLHASQPEIYSYVLLDEQIKQLLAKRQKIQAVKVYREAYNCGLKEAKEAVDLIQAEMRREGYSSIPSAPAISNDLFAEDTQRNRSCLVLVAAIVILVLGVAIFLFLAGNGF